MACHDNKVKCEWIIDSNAGSEDAGSMSRAVASSSQVPSLPVVASSSRVSCSSLPQPETCASVDALQEIAEAIHDIQHGQEEHLQRVEDNAQHSPATVEWLVQVLVDGGAPKVAEWALVSSVGGSQHSEGPRFWWTMIRSHWSRVRVGEMWRQVRGGGGKREKKEKEKRN